MERDESIKRLENYKQVLHEWKARRDPSLRTRINQETVWVRQEVVEAGCYVTITVGPPPVIGGGLVMRDVDPFQAIFNPPYNFPISDTIIDMVDRTIGVLRSGPITIPPKVAPAAPGLGLADLHAAVQDAVGQLFRDEHYTEAVGRAAKALNQMVRQKSGRSRDDGVGMMHAVFSIDPPGSSARLRLNDLADQSKIDEQEGVRFLMAGVQAAIANVDKHAELGVDGPAHAMELLAMVSFLARVVDRCQRVDSP